MQPRTLKGNLSNDSQFSTTKKATTYHNTAPNKSNNQTKMVKLVHYFKNLKMIDPIATSQEAAFGQCAGGAEPEA